MKPVDQPINEAIFGVICRCGVRLMDGDKVLWCAYEACPETKQRVPTEWQRRYYKIDEDSPESVREHRSMNRSGPKR